MTSSHSTLPGHAGQRERRLIQVARLRKGLPIAAGVLAIVCATQIIYRNMSAGPAPAPAAAEPKMLNPSFAGSSRDGRSYVLTGSEGMRDPKTETQIMIEKPIITLTSKTQQITKMTAKTGVYDELAHSLFLKGDVRVDNGSGSKFSSETALVDTRTGQVSGQSGLTAQSSAGQIQSGSYTASDEGERVIFKGGVRGRLNPKN